MPVDLIDVLIKRTHVRIGRKKADGAQQEAIRHSSTGPAVGAKVDCRPQKRAAPARQRTLTPIPHSPHLTKWPLVEARRARQRRRDGVASRVPSLRLLHSHGEEAMLRSLPTLAVLIRAAQPPPPPPPPVVASPAADAAELVERDGFAVLIHVVSPPASPQPPSLRSTPSPKLSPAKARRLPLGLPLCPPGVKAAPVGSLREPLADRALGPPRARPWQPPAPRVLLRGRVYNAATGEAMANVHVRIVALAELSRAVLTSPYLGSSPLLDPSVRMPTAPCGEARHGSRSDAGSTDTRLDAGTPTTDSDSILSFLDALDAREGGDATAGEMAGPAETSASSAPVPKQRPVSRCTPDDLNALRKASGAVVSCYARHGAYRARLPRGAYVATATAKERILCSVRIDLTSAPSPHTLDLPVRPPAAGESPAAGFVPFACAFPARIFHAERYLLALAQTGAGGTTPGAAPPTG
eukprot:TRINITY_DN4422_c0_g3_i1.p1 TRINITY_DN4422_c0_g3~~TRINITY_DN4422_c0_g3_i1.p1  ORF type:complete len:467 (+),score=44.39 TRINITY_DN4422_c0_g3_i1:106-1506(+)